MVSRRKPIETSDGSVKRSIRYLRVSSKKQMDTDSDVDPEGNSIDTQRKVTSAKEREMGLVNVGEYVEPGNSAQTIDKRPVFREMIAAHHARARCGLRDHLRAVTGVSQLHRRGQHQDGAGQAWREARIG